MLAAIKEMMRAQANQQKADFFRIFVKNSQADTFLGITVPELRKIAKAHPALTLKELRLLLRSSIHEEKILAVIVLSEQFRQANGVQQQKIFTFYLQNKKWLTDWDIIDGSAPIIVGGYLKKRDKSLLYELAHSARIWDRRIAMVATLHFIRADHFTPTLKLAKLLLDDNEDLIHKASGWMLREVGKRNLICLKAFLDKHAPQMPRTMLRYAIERFSANDRKFYLQHKT